MLDARFEYEEGPDGRWYWHLRAAGATTENEIIATGEGYASRYNAEQGVEAVKRGVLSALGINPHVRLVQTPIEAIVEADDHVSVAEPETKHYVELDPERADHLPVMA